jgi:hypothetical protein
VRRRGRRRRGRSEGREGGMCFCVLFCCIIEKNAEQVEKEKRKIIIGMMLLSREGSVKQTFAALLPPH